jgi:hypothetical protein
MWAGVFCWLDFSLLRFFLSTCPEAKQLRGKRNEEAKRTFTKQN